MKAFLVLYCLIAETLFVLALPEVGLEGSEKKKLDDRSIDDIDLSLEETSPDSQRKRDPGYYYDRPNRFPPSNFFPHSRHGHRGRIVTKLHHQVNRPFNQYGPPNHESSSHNHNRPMSSNSILNQEVPTPLRQTEFVEESPIASQNNLPFGQHTANYLPPKNQKLPSPSVPHLFSNQHHDFQYQQQKQKQKQKLQLQLQHQKYQQQQQLQLQQQEQQQKQQLQLQQQQKQQLQLQQQEQQQKQQLQLQQQQQQLQQQEQEQQQQQHNYNQQQLYQQQQYNQQQQQLHQQQQYDQVQQNFNQVQQQPGIQFQIDNQNSFEQDFNTPSFNQQQYDNNNQQISDAALFLSQNAPAISQLYEAPASNQNYAPYNQEFQQGSQNQISNQNLQIQTQPQLPQFSNQQLPSYSSGIIDSQEAFEHVKSQEKDRLISQLRLELSSRENAARFVQNNEDVRNTQTEDSVPAISLFPPRNRPLKLEHVETAFSQSGSSSSSSISAGSSGYQSYYPPPVAAPPTQPPVIATPSPLPTTTFQPSHGSSESGSTGIGTSLPAPGNLNPPTTAYPQYGGFVPSFVSPTNFVPSIPTYGTTSFPTTAIKPAENAPTHFGIPIPTLPAEGPIHSSQPIPTQPTSISLHPGVSTVSIPLGPVHHFPSHPQVIKPSPIPVIPAATPVHPTYGIHPAVVNPSFVYKPVKVYPVYYYPHLGYSSPGRKSVYSTSSAHPWSYAPSYGKPIWK